MHTVPDQDAIDALSKLPPAEQLAALGWQSCFAIWDGMPAAFWTWTDEAADPEAGEQQVDEVWVRFGAVLFRDGCGTLAPLELRAFAALAETRA